MLPQLSSAGRRPLAAIKAWKGKQTTDCARKVSPMKPAKCATPYRWGREPIMQKIQARKTRNNIPGESFGCTNIQFHFVACRDMICALSSNRLIYNSWSWCWVTTHDELFGASLSWIILFASNRHCTSCQSSTECQPSTRHKHTTNCVPGAPHNNGHNIPHDWKC